MNTYNANPGWSCEPARLRVITFSSKITPALLPVLQNTRKKHEDLQHQSRLRNGSPAPDTL